MRNRLRLGLATMSVLGLVAFGGVAIANAASGGSSTTSKSTGSSSGSTTTQSQSRSSTSHNCPNM
jgi:hypothetical protein